MRESYEEMEYDIHDKETIFQEKLYDEKAYQEKLTKFYQD